MLFVNRVMRIMLLGHSPRNVAMWLFHKILNTRILVVGYHWIVIPRLIRRIKAKDRIRIVFLPMNVGMWRYAEIYRRMESDSRFDPIVVTAPRVNQPKDSFVGDQHAMLLFFSANNYKVIPGYDEKSGEWLNLATFKPDIVFYTQPYDGMLVDGFEYWHNFFKSLICYTPYFFQYFTAEWHWNNALQNYAWRYYVPFESQIEVCKKHSMVDAKNAVSVGYFYEEMSCAHNVVCEHGSAWPIVAQHRRKHVIWAPHHSITVGAKMKISAFIELAEAMLKIRDEYCDDLVIAFKPHPMLRNNLYQCWGREKTDAYYANWANGRNSFYADGSFVQLFAESDALIHCGCSFVVDYLFVGKPCQYVFCSNRQAPESCEIGRVALDAHYHAYDVADIERFIEKVVLAGDDPKRNERENVYQKYLKSQNGKKFSENVVGDILKSLWME